MMLNNKPLQCHSALDAESRHKNKKNFCLFSFLDSRFRGNDKKRSLILFLIILFATTLSPSLASAAIFNPNFIISDNDLTDYSSMSLEKIGLFLSTKAGILKDYFHPASGKSAAEIIFNASWAERISPKYLLVTLQKEQSLVEDPSPRLDQYEWAAGYGVCDACSKDDPTIQKFKGFKNQVEYAAGGTRFYIDNPDKFSWKTGGTYTVDGQLVTFLNDATRALYTYTPHLHGNENFWNIWQRWFGKTYPDGTLLQAKGDRGVWVIQYGIKRPIVSKAALLSRYNPKNIITVEKSVLEGFVTGTPIKFANYSLLRSPEGGVYLLVDGLKRPIVSGEVFKQLGFNPEEVIPVDWGDLNNIEDGQPLTIAEAYPTGALLQDKKTGGVYWVENGVRHPIWDKAILKVHFGNQRIAQVVPEEFEKYTEGEPVLFPDGTLITAEGNPAVYVISEKKKRPIVSGEVFETYGYSWDNVVRTSLKALEIHETGEAVDVGIENSES